MQTKKYESPGTSLHLSHLSSEKFIVLRENPMLKLTIQLFLKALVIGIVVNLALLYAAEPPTPPDEGTTSQFENQSLEQSSTSPDSLGDFGD